MQGNVLGLYFKSLSIFIKTLVVHRASADFCQRWGQPT